MIDVSFFDKSKTYALVIRHAERDYMVYGQISQPLNQLGRQHSFELGTKLQGFSKYQFFSSPVDRCVETNECLYEGVFGNMNGHINSPTNVLGEPGPYVANRKANAFKTITSCTRVIELQIEHERLEGMRDTTEGAKFLTDYVIEQYEKSDTGTLLVFTTHDAILAPTIFELTGEKFNHENWPDFLDGFILEKIDKRFMVVRKNKCFDLREDFYADSSN